MNNNVALPIVSFGNGPIQISIWPKKEYLSANI